MAEQRTKPKFLVSVDRVYTQENKLIISGWSEADDLQIHVNGTPVTTLRRSMRADVHAIVPDRISSTNKAGFKAKLHLALLDAVEGLSIALVSEAYEATETHIPEEEIDLTLDDSTNTDPNALDPEDYPFPASIDKVERTENRLRITGWADAEDLELSINGVPAQTLTRFERDGLSLPIVEGQKIVEKLAFVAKIHVGLLGDSEGLQVSLGSKEKEAEFTVDLKEPVDLTPDPRYALDTALPDPEELGFYASVDKVFCRRSDDEYVCIQGWSSAKDLEVYVNGYRCEEVERFRRPDVAGLVPHLVDSKNLAGYEAKLHAALLNKTDDVEIKLASPSLDTEKTFPEEKPWPDVKSDDPPLTCYIDYSARHVDGFGAVVLWLTYPERLELELFAGGESIPFTQHNFSRPDVVEELIRNGYKLEHDKFGVVITFSTHKKPLLLVVRDPESGEALTAPIRPDYGSVEDIFSFLEPFLGTLAGKNTSVYAKLFKPWRENFRKSSPTLEVIRYGDFDYKTSKPKVSIIIPFYREWYYILDHVMTQQLDGTEDFEWIFVCDDPKIETQLEFWISCRGSQIQRPTTGVFLSENSGYATANNMGVSVARGEYVLMLNSDAVFNSAEPIHRALRAFEENPKLGLAGFTLLYEDGSVQHDGITVMPAHFYNNRYLIGDHLEKGLPLYDDIINKVDKYTDAVTGAAMLLKNPEDNIVFDDGFYIGDFEDTDLCLRLGEQGKDVLLVRNTDFYHLERQSLRHISQQRGRMFLTMMNCVEFNERWRHRYLDVLSTEDG